ncbi:hypothetical protein Peur_072763 [Populus x canadensis]
MMILTRLQNLVLVHCRNVDVLPPLERLPNIESLYLTGLKLRRLDGGFLGIENGGNSNISEGEIARVTALPKLKKLSIWHLKELEEWDGIERRVGEEDSTTTSVFIMPQLVEFRILKCPLLRALPDYVLTAPLQKFSIEYCPNLRKLYNREDMGEDGHRISHIPIILFKE